MFLNFLFNHLNLITLIVWLAFSFILIIRFYKSKWLNNISYKKLVLLALGLNIFYGLLVTWGQYYVWQNGSDLTRFLLSSPVSDIAPLPQYLEWTRSLIFGGEYGYFLYYVLGRVWLNIFISILVSLITYILLKTWNNYRCSLSNDGPKIFLILALIARWPNVLLIIITGFLISILILLISRIFNRKSILIEPIFLVITPIVLIFENLLFKLILTIF